MFVKYTFISRVRKNSNIIFRLPNSHPLAGSQRTGKEIFVSEIYIHWHCQKEKQKKYSLNKTFLTEAFGIRGITVYYKC